MATDSHSVDPMSRRRYSNHLCPTSGRFPPEVEVLFSRERTFRTFVRQVAPRAIDQRLSTPILPGPCEVVPTGAPTPTPALRAPAISSTARCSGFPSASAPSRLGAPATLSQLDRGLRHGALCRTNVRSVIRPSAVRTSKAPEWAVGRVCTHQWAEWDGARRGPLLLRMGRWHTVSTSHRCSQALKPLSFVSGRVAHFACKRRECSRRHHLRMSVACLSARHSGPFSR
jgi:hypothetical protein